MGNKEIWKSVLGFECVYEVSNLGRVKSITRLKSNNKTLKGRILNPTIIKNEYLRVVLAFDNVKKTKLVHVIVAESFLDYIPNKGIICVDHIDNDKKNNKLSNLQIISTQENNVKDRKSNTGLNYIYYSNSKRYIVQNPNVKEKRYVGSFKNLEDAEVKLKEITL